MPDKVIQILHQDYLRARNLKLNTEQFESFLAFFPALLVVASDGIVDKEEWQYCTQLAKGLGHSYSDKADDKSLTAIYRAEFKYLLDNLDLWEEEYLAALAIYLNQNNYAKTFVSDTIDLFARASHGISEEEQHKLDYLTQRLRLK